MTKKVTANSRWLSSDYKEFVVMHVIDDEQGRTWVHYRQDQPANNQEYSCYEDSFLMRFKEDASYRSI
jgi:hypothetical protein